jgi:hypothetical protein
MTERDINEARMWIGVCLDGVHRLLLLLDG